MASPPSSPFRSDCLATKVCLVTGGGSGICFEITKQLLLHGASGAVICGRRKPFLEKACRLLEQATHKKVLFYSLDVRRNEDCVKAVEYCMQQFGRLDILVNGAAGNFLSPAEHLSPKGFRTVMEIDALGTYQMVYAAFGAMRKSDGGVVINITATLQYGATWYQAHASAAKSAVDSLTRSLALEWGTYGIRVVGIAPGPIAGTPGMAKLAPDIESQQEFAKETVPLERWGSTQEIGYAAVFLATDAASYITGDTLVVDGGQWLWKPQIAPREMIVEMAKRVEKTSRAIAPQHSKL